MADDVVLMGDSSNQLQTLTDSVARWPRVIGLHINIEKTIGRVTDTWQQKINGQPAECVDEFCYLGSVVTNTGRNQNTHW